MKSHPISTSISVPPAYTLTRRGALKMGLGAALAGAAALPAAEPSSPAVVKSPRKPRRIIFMVSDGMSIGVPSLTEPFSQLTRGRGTEWMSMLQNPETSLGYFNMQSLSSLVTDSAAASSSWGSGSRIFNGAINTLPDGAALTPIAQLVHEAGRKTGLVTTVTVTHATPAGFAAVDKSRGDEDGIAEQYLDRVDVILGGGIDQFSAEKRKDKRDLEGDFAKKGYAVLGKRSELASARGQKRMLGLFTRSYLPYTLDWRNSPTLQADVPTLAEMAELALSALKDAPEGFLLQIEGGRVDHAAHSNDAAAILWDQLAFDEALGVARKFVAENPDTLLVITSDHGNSNPGLNGMGSNYNDSTTAFGNVLQSKQSIGSLRLALGALMKTSAPVSGWPEAPVYGPDLIATAAATIKTGTGLTLTDAQVQNLLLAAADKKLGVAAQQHDNFVGYLGDIASNQWGIGWTGVSHTADLTPIMATGPGREMFQGLLQNTDAFPRLTDLIGINFKNRSMSPEESKKFARLDADDAVASHWEADARSGMA